MRLARAASAFDKMECLDAYTRRHAFYGQLGLYDDTKRDSEAGERRVISTIPGVAVPPRRVVEAAGKRFILGTEYPDSFRGRTIRVGHVAHEATHLAKVLTLLQAVRGEAGLSAYAGRAWIKRTADHEHSSDMTGQFNIHFAVGEPIVPGRLVLMGSDYYMVRSAHEGPAGTLIAFADHQPAWVRGQVSVESGAYDKISEERITASVQTTAVKLRWQSMFELGHAAAPKYGPLDVVLVFDANVINVTDGAIVTADEGSWRIADTKLVGGAWVCRGVARV